MWGRKEEPTQTHARKSVRPKWSFRPSMVQIALKQTESDDAVAAASSGNNLMWARYHSTFSCFIPPRFVFFVVVVFLPISPSPTLLFPSSLTFFGLSLSIPLHLASLTAPLLWPFAVVLLSEGNARMFYCLWHRDPNSLTTTHWAHRMFCTWMWLLVGLPEHIFWCPK